MDNFCKKCGGECFVFQTQTMGVLILCTECDKNDIISISKDLLKNIDNKPTKN